jgi:hypothetical protein
MAALSEGLSSSVKNILGWTNGDGVEDPMFTAGFVPDAEGNGTPGVDFTAEIQKSADEEETPFPTLRRNW